MSSPKVCVIVVTYNGIKWIDKCLKSIESSTIKTDILIIDNGSTDGTLELLSQDGRCDYLHESDSNLGFGKANNIGLKHGYANDYDYFLLLNQDAWVEENVIEHLIFQMEADKRFGITSPLHYNGKGTNLDHFFEFYLSRMEDYQNDLKEDKIEQKLYESPFINAACWMLNRRTLEKVGLFHPLFEHYGEDDNYIDRLHHVGLKLGLDAHVKVYHDRDTSKVNPLKDDLFRLFRRSTLRSLLDPNNHGTQINNKKEAKKLAKKLSRNHSGISKLVFRIKCFFEYSKISHELKRFSEISQSEINIK